MVKLIDYVYKNKTTIVFLIAKISSHPDSFLFSTLFVKSMENFPYNYSHVEQYTKPLTCEKYEEKRGKI